MQPIADRLAPSPSEDRGHAARRFLGLGRCGEPSVEVWSPQFDRERSRNTWNTMLLGTISPSSSIRGESVWKVFT
jgi:hypothetical protein